jgi:predicted P-loop ATPase
VTNNEQVPTTADVIPLANTPSMEAFMRDDLAKSGLSPEEIGATVEMEPFSNTPIGYRIPYWLPDGKRHPQMYRVKLAQHVRGAKYTQPDKSKFPDGTYPYLPPVATLPNLKRSPADPVLIVEGEKKCLAAIKYLHRVAYGIGGCWNWSKTTDTGLHLCHADLLSRFRKGETVEVVFDGDLMSNDDVQRAAGTLRRRLRNAGLNPMFVMLPKVQRGGGLDDWLLDQQQRGVNVNDAFAKLPRTDGLDFIESTIDAWDDLKLALNDKGTPVTNESNVARVLTGHDYFAKLRFNTTMKRMELTLPDKRCLFDAEVATFIVMWLQQRLNILRITPSQVRVALDFLCSEHGPLAYNAVAELLHKCKDEWDGNTRLDEFFVRAFSIADTAYHRAVTRAFFIGAARRACFPGCKMDYVLILAGKGGIAKTTFFQHVAMREEWVKEITEGLDRSKDAKMALARGWIVEAAEGVALDLASAGGMKAIITAQVDEFRPPYGTSLQRYPRATVIVASTNDEAILKYEAGSGNRRFLPITVHSRINLALVDAEIAQVWGEATHRVLAGEKEWSSYNGAPDLESLAAPEQRSHTEKDPWTDDLLAYLSDVTHLHVRQHNGKEGYAVASHDLLTNALQLTADKKISTHGKRLRRAMQSVPGWERIESGTRVNGNIVNFSGYWRPKPTV